MSEAPNAAETPRPDLTPIVRYYLFAASIGLLLLWLAMFERGFELFSLAPVLLGALALAPSLVPPDWKRVQFLRRMPVGLLPLLVVFLVAPMEILFSPGRPQSDFFRLSDVLLTAGLLTYLVPQYRLIGLRGSIVPADPRPRADRLGGDELETRPIETARPGEWKHLFWLLPVCLIVGQLAWRWVTLGDTWNFGFEEVKRLDITRTWWRMYVLVWILGITGLLLAGGISILRLYRMTTAEAAMAGQETLWNETRGEQRRIHRWLAWMRRKKARETGLLP